MNIIINLPEVNNVAKFKATLISERIQSLNAEKAEKREIIKKVVDKLEKMS